ncbi:MAG: hypothetical protein ACR2KK_10145 [Acidimicrobiales bacterium]
MATAARAKISRARQDAVDRQRAARWTMGQRSPTPMSDAQISAVVGMLNRRAVRYVVVGGVASQLHGVPIERTRDIDLVPERAGDNLDALGLALNDLNARLWVGPHAPEGLPMTFDRISLGGIDGFLNLITDHGPVDITYRPDGTEGYPDLARSIVVISLGDEEVPVAALEDVVRSKEAAGRTKDLDALPKIRRFLRRRRGG